MAEDKRCENITLLKGLGRVNEDMVAKILARKLTGGDYEGYIRAAIAEKAALEAGNTNG